MFSASRANLDLIRITQNVKIMPWLPRIIFVSVCAISRRNLSVPAGHIIDMLVDHTDTLLCAMRIMHAAIVKFIQNVDKISINISNKTQ